MRNYSYWPRITPPPSPHTYCVYYYPAKYATTATDRHPCRIPACYTSQTAFQHSGRHSSMPPILNPPCRVFTPGRGGREGGSSASVTPHTISAPASLLNRSSICDAFQAALSFSLSTFFSWFDFSPTFYFRCSKQTPRCFLYILYF